MIKTLQRVFKQDKERFSVPVSVQQAIPIKTIWEDGIFKVGDKFSMSIKFEDLNYAVASRKDKEAMFGEYCELLNSLDSGATTKLTIVNRRLNKDSFERSVLIPPKKDKLNKYRTEMNEMLTATLVLARYPSTRWSSLHKFSVNRLRQDAGASY